MTKEEILFLKSMAGDITEDVSDYDLKKIFKLAYRHNVLPLSFEHIAKSESFNIEEHENVKMKVFSIVFSQTKRSEEFRKIYKILVEEGFKPLVLKGIICRSMYGDLCDHRPSGDEDILVRKEEFFKISEVLERYGYIPENRVNEKVLEGIEEITFKGSSLNIEVHLNIIGTENAVRQKMNRYFENVFENAVKTEINGQVYYTLNYTDHYIYLFYHMFKHFATSGVGIRQALDIFKFNEKHRNKIDFDAVREAVCAINSQKLYGDVIEIGNRYMGFTMENSFGVYMPERLLEDIFSAGAFGNDNPEQVGSKVKVMSAMNDGKTSKIKLLFPPINSMREHYTVLYKHPYLLPFIWIYRIIRYIFRVNSGKTYNVNKSEAIADKKITLLRDYDII